MESKGDVLTLGFRSIGLKENNYWALSAGTDLSQDGISIFKKDPGGMHLWQYEAQFGFCFGLDLTTLGQANMLRRKPIPGILAGSLALLKLLSSPIRNLLLTSPPWQGFILILTFLRYVLTVTDVYWHDVWHVLIWNNMETEDGPPHVAWWCSLPPAPPASPCRASCEKNQYFLRMKDWKGLERIGEDWKGGIQWKYLSRSKSFLVYWVF